MARSVEEMAHTYIKEMIAVQPKGPYHLLGWSFGGALAFEMARQINAAGEKSASCFLDAVAPEKKLRVVQAQLSEDESEQKFLEGIARELNTLRQYAKLPPLKDTEGH